jgi:hypothetical protein
MIRMQTLLITTAVAIALPLTWAGAQTPAHGTKCGPVAFSNEKMAYVSMPCAEGATGAASTNAVGNTSPNVAQTGSGVTASSSMIKQEIKQESAAGSLAYGVPMGPSMAAAPSYAVMSNSAMSDQCGDLRATAITDEYRRKYNCRGDRIR